MDYQAYKRARDLSWRTLIDAHVGRLPVKVSQLCAEYGATLRSYEVGEPYIRELQLLQQCEVSDGFAVRCGPRLFIFYNQKLVPGRVRFTIAHELGHILLGHLGNEGFTLRNREPAPDDLPEEQEANVFASRLLAPACVLHDLGADSPERISALCDISMQAATYRAERMGELNQRGRFGSSPLEQRVHEQFADFIAQARNQY